MTITNKPHLASRLAYYLGLDEDVVLKTLERIERGNIPVRYVDTSQYTHTNSKGVTYYLNSMTVPLRGGKPQTIYFFARTPRTPRGEPSPLPADRIVLENPRTGFPTVIRRDL